MGSVIKRTGSLDNNQSANESYPSTISDFNDKEYIKNNVGYRVEDNAVFCKSCNTIFNSVLFEDKCFNEIYPELCTCGKCKNINPGNVESYISELQKSYGVDSQEYKDPVFSHVIPFDFIPHDRAKRNKQAYRDWKKDKHGIVEGMRKSVIQKALKDNRTGLLDKWNPSRSLDYLDLLKLEAYANVRDSFKEYVNESRDPNLSLRNFAIERFTDYLDCIKDKRCYVVGTNIGTNKQIAFEVYNRYSPNYVKDLMEKLEPMSKEDYFITSTGSRIDLNRSVMVTLTYDPNENPSMEECWDNITNDFNRYRTRLSQIVGKLEYTSVIESQQNGYPHIHAVFFNVDWLLPNGDFKSYKSMKKRNDKPTIQNIWKKGFTYVDKSVDNKRIRNPLSYMFKYFENNFGEKTVSDKGFLTQSFLWLFNRRSYNTSRELGKWLRQRFKDRLNRDGMKDIEGNIQYPGSIDWIGILFINERINKFESTNDKMEYIKSLIDKG